jgi:hypothetical protein
LTIFKKAKQAAQKLQSVSANEVLSKLEGLPFWIWNKEEHEAEWNRGICCFNHVVPAGLPVKDNIRHPIYPWQKPIVDILLNDDDNNIPFFQRGHLALLKARGSGGSELGLRVMMWLATKDRKLAGSQMAIVSGNSSLLSIGLINRCKKLFWNEQTNEGIVFDTKESVLEINGVRIEAFMSHRIEGLRGLPNLSFGIADESSQWPLSEQQPVKDCLLGYVPKRRDLRLFFLSTAGYPKDLMDSIFNENEQTCLFQRIRMDWTVPLNTLLDQRELDKIRLTNTNTWLREFCLEFAGFQGNVYPPHIIDQCVKDYNLNKIDVEFGNFSLGVDLGSTVTGITLLQWNQADRKVYVILSEEYVNMEYNRILRKVSQLINTFSPDKIYVDASNSFLIRDLKQQFHEEPFEIMKKRIAEEYKDQGMKDRPYETCEKYMRIIPIPWNREGVPMMQHSKYVMERNQLRINPIFDKLITSLRTAYSENDKLNKDLTLHNDCYDSFILALRRYRK